MLHKLVITRIPNGFQDCIKGTLHCLNRCKLILIEEHDADVRLVKRMVVEEEMEHLIYAGDEPLLPLFLPLPSRVIGLQLL